MRAQMFTSPVRMLVAALFCAVASMFVPMPLQAGAAVKPSCCEHMEMPADSDSGNCPGHQQAPVKPQQDTNCCQACALGLALLFTSPPPLLYVQTGELSRLSLNARSHSLPHRPPVPPPRAALG